jgi:hypothetical protein
MAALLIGAVPAGAARTRTSPHDKLSPAPLITTVSGEGLGILVAWTPASGTEVITSYTLQASAISVKGVKVAANCTSPAATTAPGTDTMAVVTHVCADVAYAVTMSATGPAGTSAASLASNPVVPLPATVPAVPVVTSVLGGDSSLVVSWSSPVYDGGRPIRGYEVRATAGTSTVTAKTGPRALSVTLDKLTNAVTYSVSVVALNGVGASPAATSAGLPSPPHAPGAPEDLSAEPAATNGTIDVSWAAPIDDGGAPVTSYLLEYQQETATASPSGAITYAPRKGVAPVVTDVTGTSRIVSGLTTKQFFYAFSVQATNAKGTSASSPTTTPVRAYSTTASSTVVLDATDLAGISSDSDGKITWTYTSDSAAPTAIQALAAGQVLLGGISEQTPDGVLVNVVSVANSTPGVYVVHTSSSTLYDAFNSLTTQTSLNPLAPPGNPAVRNGRAGRFVATAPGVTLLARSGIGFSTSVTIGLDLSLGNRESGTSSNGVNVEGSISGDVELTPSMSFDGSIHHGWLDIPDGVSLSFAAALKVDASADLSVSVSRSTPATDESKASEKWKIGEIDEPPIEVPVGPVPLVLTPKMPVYLEFGVSGSVSISVSTSFTWGASASWSSSDPGHLALKNLSKGPTGKGSPSLAASASVSAALVGQPELEIYGFTGPDIDVSIALVATVTLSTDKNAPWFELDLVLSVDAGWNVQLFTYNQQVSVELKAISWTIFELKGTIPPTVRRVDLLAVTPDLVSVQPGTSEQFTVPNAHGTVSWSLRDSAGDTITKGGKLSVVGPVGRELFVSVTDSAGDDSGQGTVIVGAIIGPPTDLRATANATGTGATVSWKPPALPAGTKIASYTITTMPPTSTVVTSGTTTSTDISGLTPAGSYVVSVWARTAADFQTPAATTLLSTTPIPPPSWANEPTPNPSDAQGSVLDAVSCTSSSACTAVGDYTTSSGDYETLAESGHDTSWSIQRTPTPTGAEDASLAAVSCTSSTACIAVGSYFEPSSSRDEPLAESWNGNSWSIQTTRDRVSGGANLELAGVSCTSSTACTAVGSYISTTDEESAALVETWNGRRWSIQRTPAPPSTEYPNLTAVSCTSSRACTAVGYYSTNSVYGETFGESWNGSTWSIQAMPIPSDAQASYLNGVSCTSSTACTAVGYYYLNSSGDGVTLAESWNGRGWSIQPTPPDPSDTQLFYLDGVSCTSSTACTAVGEDWVDDSTTNEVALAESWNGTTWSLQDTLNPSDAAQGAYLLVGVSCRTSAACTAVGNYRKEVDSYRETLAESIS